MRLLSQRPRGGAFTRRSAYPKTLVQIQAWPPLKIKPLAEIRGPIRVANGCGAFRLFSGGYHPLPNIPCNTDATRGLHNVPGVALHRADVQTALDLWLSGFASENTRRAYRKEIEAFTTFAGWDNIPEAVAHFLALEDGQAHAVADKWRAEKIARGLSPASVNRSMAALNSLVASARRHGITALRLEAKGVKSKPYRDTKGPGLRGVQAMLAVATDRKRPEKAARDAAIIRLAYGLGLRRGEISGLNIGHCDLVGERLHVLGKGRSEREAMTIPANVKQALSAWLSVRGTDAPDAPLFIALDNHSRGAGKRITGAGIFHISPRTRYPSRPQGPAAWVAPHRDHGGSRRLQWRLSQRRGPSPGTPPWTRSGATTTTGPITPARSPTRSMPFSVRGR